MRSTARSGVASTTACVLLAFATFEMIALAPARELARPALWALQLVPTLGLALLLAGCVHLVCSRLTPRSAIAPLDVALLGVAAGVWLVHFHEVAASLLAGLPWPAATGAAAATAAGAAAFAIPRTLSPSRRTGPWPAVAFSLGAAALGVVALVAVRSPFRGEGVGSLKFWIGGLTCILGMTLLVICWKWGFRRALAAATVVGAALLLLRLGLPNPQGWVESSPGPAVAAPLPQGTPLVLVVVLDTFRADALELDTAGTPQLARLAQRADVFPDGIANGSWTLTGHASLLSGLTVARHKTDDTPEEGFARALPDAVHTLHERFASAGYRTTCVSANGIVGPGSRLSRGCERYRNPGHFWMQSLLPWKAAHALVASSATLSQLVLEWTGINVNAEAHEVVDLALESLDDGDERANYLFLNFLDVHAPYPAADPSIPEAQRRALSRAFALQVFGVGETEEIWRDHRETLRAYYDSQAAALDAELGRLFDALDARGLLDPAIVAVTSDHGEAFFENPERVGYFGHHSAWEPSVRIPLILKRPGQASARRMDKIFQQVDLVPTLLELAGLPEAQGLDGTSLLRDSEQRLVVTEWYRRRGAGTFPFFPENRLAIYEGPFKLVREGTVERLYDLRDPSPEARDVKALHPELAREMSRRLEALQARAREEHMQRGDSDLGDQLRALGYAE